MKTLLPLLIALLFSGIASAQEIGYGVTVRGRINDALPRVVHSFEGLRGEIISISLSFTDTLEPIVLLAGATYGVFPAAFNADSAPGRDVQIASLLLPASDTWQVIVARFGGGLGTTSGEYALTVTRIGVSSQAGSALRFGDTVYNTITDSQPRFFYSFFALRGNVISIRMQRASGDLDPVLLLVNSRSEVIAQEDDAPGTTDAVLNDYLIAEDGSYAIVATRYGGEAGTSRGSFVLTLNGR
jgi:hypothetical protein